MALAWTVNGIPAIPTPRRPLAPVLTDRLAARAKAVVHSGVFELQGLAPATPHRIALAAGGERLDTRRGDVRRQEIRTEAQAKVKPAARPREDSP